MKKSKLAKSFRSKSNKSKVGNISKSLGLSPKQLKKGLGVFFGVVILLLVLARVPATSNWPVVSWVKSLISSASTTTSRESNVLTLINRERTSRGLRAVTLDTGTLGNCSENWVSYMNRTGDYRHNPNYSSSSCTGNNYGGGEIIACPDCYDGTDADLVAAWMASADHKSVILEGAFTHAGVAQAPSGDGRVWWTVNFGINTSGGGQTPPPPASNYQLQNGSFESGIRDNVPFSSPRSLAKGVWYGYATGGGQTARVACSCAANVPGGGGSYVGLVNDTSSSAFNSLSQVVDAMPGRTYELFAHSLLLSNGGSTNNYQRLYLTFLDSNYNRIGAGKYYNANAGYYGWAGNKVVDVAPSNARYVEVFIYAPNDRGPSKYDWDKVTLSIK